MKENKRKAATELLQCLVDNANREEREGHKGLADDWMTSFYRASWYFEKELGVRVAFVDHRIVLK